MVKKTIEDSALFDILGKSQESKILDLFIEGRSMQYCFSDVVERAKVKRNRITPILEKFNKIGLLRVTAERKNRKFYQINSKNAYAKHLIKIYDSILKDIENFA